MSYSRKLASSISSAFDGPGTRLAITDLTYMWDEEVCIAGVGDDGRCVRPIRQGGVQRSHLFRDGRLAVYPRAKVRFDFSPTEIVPPHIEDMRFEPKSVAQVGACNDSEWEEVLRSTCFPSVAEMFDGYLEDGRRVPPDAKTRSLGTIGNVEPIKLTVDDSLDRWRVRLDFADSNVQYYRRFPINDLAFRLHCQERIDELGDVAKAEQSVLRELLAADRVYLRIGLARPQKMGDYPLACWTQVTGVYTFPDYLKGKTFADFAQAVASP